MKKLIIELRRREVFRTAGLYVGICWILIEGASVVLPTFDAPDWLLRAMIIAAIVGFPVTIVLAWIYDVSDKGIVVQSDATDTVVVPFGGRKGDFIVIGVLTVALAFSVYMNIKGAQGDPEPLEPVSILIADFENRTGDPLFDGTLEQTLNIGIEGAPFITAFNRSAALSQVANFRPGGGALDADVARLVAVREGIKLVLSGSVSEADGRYEFIVHTVDAATGEPIIEVEERAANKASVLGVVSEIAGIIREKLGDTSFDEETLSGTETFTASNLEAAKAYTDAQHLAYTGDYEAAAERYEEAIARDPNFGRAYSGWALAAFNLGRDEEATQLWQKALAYMNTMTERERHRTLGLYYMAVTRNYQKAIESYRALVDKYPADGAGHNNLAVAYFATLDFEAALEEGRRVLEIYPSNLFYQQNFALYAMYAGDFALAEQRARKVIDADESRFYAWLPIAIANLSRGDIEAARKSYRQMAETGEGGASLASLGLADIALYMGNYGEAATILQAGIDADIAAENLRATATKYIALAEANAGAGEIAASMEAIEAALEVSQGLARQVPAALAHIEHGHVDMARGIGDELTEQLQAQRRAYGNLILGIIELQNGQHAAAIDRMTTAISLSDHWLIRFYLGKAYLAAGSAVEAMDEFETLEQRRGEAAALFLDDLPTWRFLATLPYWRGRAQEAANMADAARSSYAEYVARRPDSDPLAVDARQRLSSLSP